MQTKTQKILKWPSKKLTKTIIPFVISALLLVGIYLFAPDLSYLPEAATINHVYLIAAFILFLINYILRTIRIRMLFSSKNTSSMQIFGITCLYGALNYFLPARSGELTYLFLTKHHLSTKLHESSAHLLLLRMYDALVINISAPLILLYFGDHLSLYTYYGIAATMLTVNIIALAIIKFSLYTNSKTDTANIKNTNTYLGKILIFMQLVKRSLAKNLQATRQLSFIALSIAIWFTIYSMFSLIALAFSYPSNIPLMATISLLLFIFSLIPAQGIANIGPHEAAWSLGYSFIGVSATTALMVSLHTHFVLLIFTSILALTGYISLKFHKKQE